MSSRSEAPIPVIDLAGALAGDETARGQVSTAIDDACRNSGFFIITGHGLDSALLARVVDSARQFFHLSQEEKARVAPPGAHHFRGFLGLDTTALAATLGDETPPDLCESFNVSGFDDPAVRSRAEVDGADAIFWPNLWPDRPPELRPAFERYFEAIDRLSRSLLTLIARALSLPENWFDEKVHDATSLLMTNWYPAVDRVPIPGQLRRGGHTDYGAFTIVATEQIPGLQIYSDGQWRDVPIVPGGFVVNLGDLMARWTNDRWVSTLHRVVIPDGDARHLDRISVPFFFQPNYSARIETIPTTITTDHPARYEPVISGEWITAKSMSMLENGDE